MKVMSMTTAARAGTAKADEQAADPSLIPDDRAPLERERAERADAVRLRLLFAAAGGGDEGELAKAAIAAIRRAEAGSVPLNDRQIKGAFLRQCEERGFNSHSARFYRAYAELRTYVMRPLD
jgi:hypothetical protein